MQHDMMRDDALAESKRLRSVLDAVLDAYNTAVDEQRVEISLQALNAIGNALARVYGPGEVHGRPLPPYVPYSTPPTSPPRG